MLNCASVSSRISPDLPPCFFTLFARATVVGSPSHLSPVAEWSAVSFSQKGHGFHDKQVSVHSNQSRGMFLFGLSTGRRCLHESKIEWITRSCSPFSRKSLRSCGPSFPRPMTHSFHNGTANSFLLVSRYSSSSFFFLASICS